jgi:hypothetical protein
VVPALASPLTSRTPRKNLHQLAPLGTELVPLPAFNRPPSLGRRRLPDNACRRDADSAKPSPPARSTRLDERSAAGRAVSRDKGRLTRFLHERGRGRRFLPMSRPTPPRGVDTRSLSRWCPRRFRAVVRADLRLGGTGVRRLAHVIRSSAGRPCTAAVCPTPSGGYCRM